MRGEGALGGGIGVGACGAVCVDEEAPVLLLQVLCVLVVARVCPDVLGVGGLTSGLWCLGCAVGVGLVSGIT